MNKHFCNPSQTKKGTHEHSNSERRGDMKKHELLETHFMISLNGIKGKIRVGQKVWLRDDISALCVKLHPQILNYIGDVGTFSKNGSEFSANWSEIFFKDKNEEDVLITVPDSYLEVMFEF